MSLTVRSTEKRPGVFILYPIGRLDSNTYTVLEKKIDYLMREGQAWHLTLDMTGVDYISSLGSGLPPRPSRTSKKMGVSFP